MLKSVDNQNGAALVERIEPPLNAASNDTLVVGQLLKWSISDNTVNVLYALVCFPFPGVTV